MRFLRLAAGFLAVAGCSTVAFGGDAPPPPPPPVPTPPAAAPDPTRPAPRATVDRAEHDFGLTKQETELRTEFTLKNEGTAPLTFDLRADCGCAAATADVASLAPGEATTLRVLFRTFSYVGVLAKRIRILSNDPANPTLELRFRADISKGVVVDPARFFFGPIEAGESPRLTIKVQWKEGVGEPFRLLSLETPGADLELTTKAFDAPPWHGFEVSAAFRTKPKVGTVSGTAILRTDSKETPRIALPITAFVSGKIWVDRREVSLGMLPAGKERTVSVGCRALRPGVELGEVTAKARGGRVVARAIRSGAEWLVEIRSPETAEPGRLDDVVEVTCALPGETAEIAVRGEVLKKP